MIEFKQIIGRGTRLFDGKDYFTVYDFVEATNTSTIPNGTANSKNLCALPLNGATGKLNAPDLQPAAVKVVSTIEVETIATV